MSIETTAGDFAFGRVIQETIAAARGNFLTYFAVALICIALPDALFGYLALTKPTGIVGGIVSMIGQNLVQAAVVYGVVTQMNGRTASFKECFDAAGKVLLPLLIISILAGIGIFIGLVLLIVPGIILACMWAVTTPVRVIEGPNVQRAFGRSIALTKGHRLAVAGLFVIFAVLLGLSYGAAYGVFSFAGPLIVEVIVSPVLNAVVAVVASAGFAVLYLELRRTKEGVGPESLASVFD